jgi:ankyrin repeat protein
LRQGADINNTSGYFNYPPLISAITNGVSNELIEEFLNNEKLNINATDNSGKTALHEAVAFKRNDLIEQIIAHGAQINAEDNNGSTPLNCAEDEFRPNEEAADILLKHGAQKNDIQLIIKPMAKKKKK